MFRKIFVRLVVLGTLTFALFFLLAAAEGERQIQETDSTESGVNTAEHPAGEFILETIVGSVLIGIK